MRLLRLEITRAAPRPSFEQEWAAVPRYRLFPDCPERLLTTAVRLALERHPFGNFKATDGKVIVVSEDKFMHEIHIKAFAADGEPLAWIQMLEGGLIRQAAVKRMSDKYGEPRWEMILDAFDSQVGLPPEQEISVTEEADLIRLLMTSTPLDPQDHVSYQETGYIFRNL